MGYEHQKKHSQSAVVNAPSEAVRNLNAADVETYVCDELNRLANLVKSGEILWNSEVESTVRRLVQLAEESLERKLPRLPSVPLEPDLGAAKRQILELEAQQNNGLATRIIESEIELRNLQRTAYYAVRRARKKLDDRIVSLTSTLAALENRFYTKHDPHQSPLWMAYKQRVQQVDGIVVRYRTRRKLKAALVIAAELVERKSRSLSD